jgi:DNA polymerase III psi subunit
VNAAARWEPARQRRALRLMGIEPPVFRAAPARVDRASLASPAPAPARASAPVTIAGPARLRIMGLSAIAAADGLLAGILRSLGVSAREVAFDAGSSGPDDSALPTLAFGPAQGDARLPSLAALRADPRAKRTAWQETLRPLARRMQKS